MSHLIPAEGRIAELLADRSVDALVSEEFTELDLLLRDSPGIDGDEFDRIAAEIACVPIAGGAVEEMPSHLRASLERGLASLASGSPVVATAPVQEPTIVAPQAQSSRPASSPANASPSSGTGIFPWVALAAAVILAIAGWWPRLASEQGPSAVELTLAERRDQLAETATDLDSSSWATHKRWKDEELGVSGEVIWSDELQEGYMTIRGMPRNDAEKRQYQLWIYDEVHAAPRPPIDGGVFDCNDNGEAVIAINAKLLVRNPSLFGITIEEPGGVVVSDQDELVLIAPVG